MKINKSMLVISALVIVVSIGVFAFNIYNDTKLVKINSADIIVTEAPGIDDNERVITVEAGERAIFYSFDGGKTYQTDNSYIIVDNQSVHIVLQDSDKRVIGEKYYNEAYFVEATGLSLDKTNIKLVVGESETITATIKPNDATDKKITWTSSDTDIATVEDGEVTGKKAGTATITATANNGKKATCKVIVRSINNGGNHGGTNHDDGSSSVVTTIAVNEISLNKTDIKLIVGKEEKLTATINPSDATDKSVTWSTTNESVATVEKGKVVAKKAGSATIIATASNGKTATCDVTVSNGTVDVKEVKLNISDIKLVVGESESLMATIYPSNATNQHISWSSSNTSVATVTDGKVTAKKAGSATITATSSNGKKATCKVTVTSSTGSSIAVTGISLNKTSLSLTVGNNSTLTATINPSNATNKKITWSSSNTSVATVENGKVVAKKAGSATITATSSNGKIATCKVTVSSGAVAVTKVTLNTSDLKLLVGESSTLIATISPSNATNKTVTWSSSNTSVATVENGKVVAKKAGSATITVTTNNGKTATCKVTVSIPTIAVTSVSLNKTSLSLAVGNTDTLTATISPSNATTKTISWSSSDTSVATVSGGKVTAKKAGTTTITATASNGKKATCKVTVTNPTIAVTSVSLNKTSLSLTVGNSSTLTATINPSNATTKTITWSSSDASVATVSGGKVTAKKAGTATITATANNGKKATCTVTVTSSGGSGVAVTDISLNKTNIMLVVGKTETLTATINPSNATDKNITWSSSNTSVATVANGKITAKKIGQATITATSSNGKTATCKVVVLTKDNLIDVRNMSFKTYIKNIYTGTLNNHSKMNFQNFGFRNFRQPGETIFIIGKYVGSAGKEQPIVRIAETYNRVSAWDHNAYNDVTKWTVESNLSSYYSHGQSFDLELSPNGNEWLMFLSAATEPGGTQYLRVFKAGERTAWKEFPNLKGQPTIDLENDLIAMVSGSDKTGLTCKIYKYSDLINNNKETLIYSFTFNRYTREGGKYYTNGFQVKDGYIYEIRGCEGDNGIEVWNYLGERVIYRDISLVSGSLNEPQGIQIYNGVIYIGVTEFPANYDGRYWTYTVGYLS